MQFRKVSFLLGIVVILLFVYVDLGLDLPGKPSMELEYLDKLETFFAARPAITCCRDALDETNNNTCKMKHDVITPQHYINMTQNCQKFKASRRYVNQPLTKFEENFPIAYSILMYKNIEQFERLLRAIYRPQHTICVHVDLKSPQMIFDAVRSIGGCFDNVILASKRSSVEWGTFTVLEPEMTCMNDVMKKERAWKYFINLTGQEFPLRTNLELTQQLRSLNGKNDVSKADKGFSSRWETAAIPPHNIKPIKGDVHVALSRSFVEFAIHDERAIDFLAWTRNTSIPDETFFSTLNYNPQLKVPGSYQGDAGHAHHYISRYKNWGHLPCHGKFTRNICILAIGDLPLLVQSQQLFANKFFLEYNHEIITCLEEVLRNRSLAEYKQIDVRSWIL